MEGLRWVLVEGGKGRVGYILLEVEDVEPMEIVLVGHDGVVCNVKTEVFPTQTSVYSKFGTQLSRRFRDVSHETQYDAGEIF